MLKHSAPSRFTLSETWRDGKLERLWRDKMSLKYSTYLGSLLSQMRFHLN